MESPAAPSVADELRRLAAENQVLGPVLAVYAVHVEREGEARSARCVLHADPDGLRMHFDAGADRMEWRFTPWRQTLLIVKGGGPPRLAVLDMTGLLDALAGAMQSGFTGAVVGTPRLQLHADVKTNRDPSRKTHGEISFRASYERAPGSALGWLDALQSASVAARVGEDTIEFELDPERKIRLELSRAHGFPTRVWVEGRLEIQLVKFRQGDTAGRAATGVPTDVQVDPDLSAQLARGVCHVWFGIVRELARRERDAGEPATAEARFRRVLEAALEWTVRQCAPPEQARAWAVFVEMADRLQSDIEAAPPEQAQAVRAEAAARVKDVRAHFAGVIEAELAQFRALLVAPEAPAAGGPDAADRAIEDAAVETAFRKHYAEPLWTRFEETLGALGK